jgi:hypothetical protein
MESLPLVVFIFQLMLYALRYSLLTTHFSLFTLNF